MIASYEELIQASKGIVKAVIISSEPLKKKSLDTIKEAVVKLAGAGKTVRIVFSIFLSMMSVSGGRVCPSGP